MFERYIVKGDETIESIAELFNVLPSQIIKLNQLEGVETLPIGAEILIPPAVSEEKFTTYRVKRGDNLYDISRRYNIDPEILAQLNGLDIYDYLYPDQLLIVPEPGVRVYITEEGDTLLEAANKLNTTINRVLMDNKEIYLRSDQLITYREK